TNDHRGQFVQIYRTVLRVVSLGPNHRHGFCNDEDSKMVTDQCGAALLLDDTSKRLFDLARYLSKLRIARINKNQSQPFTFILRENVLKKKERSLTLIAVQHPVQDHDIRHLRSCPQFIAK